MSSSKETGNQPKTSTSSEEVMSDLIEASNTATQTYEGVAGDNIWIGIWETLKEECSELTEDGRDFEWFMDYVKTMQETLERNKEKIEKEMMSDLAGQADQQTDEDMPDAGEADQEADKDDN